MNDATRPYSSPLRETQARQTRDLVLDALTELLNERRPDEIATREIAARAGVSQPTVYRYFPDREALLEGLVDRFSELATPTNTVTDLSTLDGLNAAITWFFAVADENAVEATAEALLNADPRRFAQDTRRHSDELQQAVVSEFAHLDERSQVQLAGLLRCLGSSQTWLRMREEFGVPGTESGPVVAWAMDTLLREARNGGFPETPDVSDPRS